MNGRITSAALFMALLAVPLSVQADADADLAAGRAALQQAQLDQALPLLASAAEALPKSVEAQLALGDCQLRLGHVDKALDQYQAVLKLSADHARAKRMVAALTANRGPFEKQVAAARSLMAASAFDQASELLTHALKLASEPAQRTTARLLFAESQLWGGSSRTALTEAIRVVQDSQNAAEAGQARVIQALALLNQKETDAKLAATLIQQAGDLKAPWSGRAQLALVLIELSGSGNAAAISKQLGSSLKDAPHGSLYRAIVERSASQLFKAADARLQQGNLAGTLEIIWPMVSSQAVPKVDAVLKPIPLSGGWLMNRGASQHQQRVVRILASIGKAESDYTGNKASLFGYWLAAEVLRQLPPDYPSAMGESLLVVASLSSISRPSSNRQAGELLSQADQLQRELLVRLAGEPATADQQQQLVQHVLGQVARYQKAGDLKTGVAQFVSVDAAAKPPKLSLAGGLQQLPPGPAHQTLLSGLAGRNAELGNQSFQDEATAVVKAANPSVNEFDQVALLFYGQIATVYPNAATDTKATDAIVARYTNAKQWDQAVQAAGLFYASAGGDAGRWASVRIRIAQAINTEDELLAARRALGQELSPLLKATLAESLKILRDGPGKSNRTFAIQTANGLVARYANLSRPDLSQAVVATLDGEQENPPLADWGAWTRANLLHQRATTALATLVSQTDDIAKLALHNLHKSEIQLLNQLIVDHPRSEFASAAVKRVLQISSTYQSYGAFDTAQTVLADFLKAQPKLALVEGIEYRAVQVLLAKAHAAFARRTDSTQAPVKLSDEYAAAIDALAAFLKAHPTGDYSPAAEDHLFAVARTYGTAGAWPVARGVLDRFTAAIPNFRSPGHLKLLQAATYLGELQGAHGLNLLTPSPKPHAQPVGDFQTMLAMGNRESGFSSGDQQGAGKGEGGALFENNSRIGANKGPKAGGIAGGGFGGGAKLPPPGIGLDTAFTPKPQSALPAKPSESSLAMIRQSQQRQYQRLAMLEDDAKKVAGRRGDDAEGGESGQAIVLPSGVLLSEAELKRQDDAADKAYAILIGLAKSKAPTDVAISEQARGEMMWLFGFFEEQLRADRAIVLIKRYLGDHPTDPERVALAYRTLTDQIVRVRQRQPNQKVDQAFIDARHSLFQQARLEIAAFIKANPTKTQWVNAAHLLNVDSFQQEAQLVAPVSAERAGGLLLQCAQAVLSLLKTAPSHPESAKFPNRVWTLADQISKLGQNDQAIYVLRRITLNFPTHALANQALMRIAGLYAANLSNPLQAVETYQEYLSRTDGDASVPAQIFQIAGQLAAQKRFLEALHVYGVFVDSFPTDARAADALHAIGRTHQSNEAWEDAIRTYDRIVEEYPAGEVIPQVKLDVAECRINLGQWSAARKLYEDYLTKFPKHDQVAVASSRLDILKKLDRFQDLLADEQIDRNKDDAQFQIGRTVLQELRNPVKAVEEFRKVIAKFPKSDVADDAQIEIGQALLTLNRMDEGRAELLKVPAQYPNSALADDALFLVGRSYEGFALKLAGVTVEKAREESFAMEQRDAYVRFNKDLAETSRRQMQTRAQLKKDGDEQQLALNEAFDASRLGSVAVGQLFCQVTQAELQSEAETALQIANRQDRINDAFREAVVMYVKAATDYPLGDKTDQSLLRIADIFETRLKDRPSAMQTYQKIVKLFPGTPVAEDAAWKVAQFYVEEGQYAQAADAYKTFIRNYPASTRVADAQFGMAEVMEQLGQWVDAMDAYEVFRQKFGKHPKVKLAVEQIVWIKTYRK